ncbi:MAG: hypothetical protein JO061_07060 [Acidobacteriaceae bacterium]|nr:hypothetical protein [Acidobacteriaceae bacterium]
MRGFAFCLVAFWFVAGGMAQDSASVTAVVVTAGKSWSAGGRKLSRGQTLAPGTELNQSGNESSDLILDCGSAGWLSYSCLQLPCTVHSCQLGSGAVRVLRVDLRAGNNGSTSPGHSWFPSLFRREPASVVVLGIREGGQVTDAVVAESGSTVHLGPALNRVLEGKYCFRFTPLPPGNPAASKEATLDWDRSADAEGVLEVPGIEPGLYAVQKSSSEASGACTFKSDANSAWVLVASTSDFPRLRSEWKDFTERIREIEREGASPTVLLTLRHAALAHLADSVQQGK